MPQAFAEEQTFSTLCDTLVHAHPDLHPMLLHALQIIAAASNADLFASRHHPHLVRALSHALHRNDQAMVVCIKQCVAMKLSEMQHDLAAACLAQQQDTCVPPPAKVVAEDVDSESDQTMFEIEL